VKSPVELARQVGFVLRAAEWVLGRPVRHVLDVGAGEGQWRTALRRLRPGVRYDGVDPSAHAVARFGGRRGLLAGGITDLDGLPLRTSYDLVVCCGMLNYLDARTLRAGLAQVARRTGGLAYLELFAAEDVRAGGVEGDTAWPRPRPAAWYRRVLREAGFVPVGLQCHVTETSRLSALEWCGEGR
jgi:SAM-dependent methyltransferase